MTTKTVAGFLGVAVVLALGAALPARASTFQLQSGTAVPLSFTPAGLANTTTITVTGILTLDVPGQAQWKLKIRDSRGEEVWRAEQETGYTAAGTFPISWPVVWNGQDEDHHVLPAGFYQPTLKVEIDNGEFTFPLDPVQIYDPGPGNEVGATITAGAPARLSLPQGQVLSIPANALPAGTVVILRKPADNHGHWNAVDILPEGLALAAAASLTIPYNPAIDIPAGKTEADVRGIYYNPLAHAWYTMAPSALDTAAKTVTITLGHFSVYAAAALNMTAPTIASITFSNGRLVIALQAGGVGQNASKYLICYDTSAHGTVGNYPNEVQRVAPSGQGNLTVDAPFFGWTGPSPSQIWVALRSVDASGNLDINYSSEVQVASPGVTTVWPGIIELPANLNGQTLTSDHVYQVRTDLAEPTLSPGSSLTIEPGVVILVPPSQYGKSIEINGALAAVGERFRKICITSSNHKSVIGGTDTAPQNGDWLTLDLHVSSTTGVVAGSVFMDYCEVSYGGGRCPYCSPANTWVYLDRFTGGATATITNTTISHSSHDGLRVVNYDGLVSTKTLYIDNITSSYNTGSGIYLDGYGSRKVILTTPMAGDGHLDITATNNGRYPVEIAFNSVGELEPGAGPGPSVVAINNTSGNAIAWNGGGIISPQTMHWYDLGVPYALIDYYFTFNPGTAVTLDPGVVIKMKRGPPPNYYPFPVQIEGSLAADGTKPDGTIAPVIFTSWDDNTVGGITGNGDPQSGSWGYFLFHNTANSGSLVLNHCEIRYGGHDGWGGSLWVNVYAKTNQDDIIDIRNTTISHSGTAGLLLSGYDSQSRKVVMTACTIQDCTGPAISAYNMRQMPLLLATPRCAFTGNNCGRPNPQMAYSGTNPVFVDASLCYWGYDDLDNWAVVPDGWRVSPWYTSDPTSAAPLLVDKWTGNFNPNPPTGYKGSFELGLTSALSVSKAWRMRIWGPNPADPPQGTPLFTAMATGVTFSPAPWGAGAAPGKYIVYITDDNQSGGPILRTDVWADSSLFATIETPAENGAYGNIIGNAIIYKGLLQSSCVAPQTRYQTLLLEKVLPSSTWTKLGPYEGQCATTVGQTVPLVTPQAISYLGGNHVLSWAGNQQGVPARWIEILRHFAVANLNVSLDKNQAEGSPGQDPANKVITLTVDTNNLTGTFDPANSVVKIVRRKLVHHDALCNYCISDSTTQLPDTGQYPATFGFADGPEWVLTHEEPVVNGEYKYKWLTHGHEDGLYACTVVARTTVGGTAYTNTFWANPVHKALGGWVRPTGSFGANASTDIVRTDGFNGTVEPSGSKFKYDGRHLMKYSFDNWDAYQYGSGAHSSPLIMSIHGGFLSTGDRSRSLSTTLAPLEGVGGGANTTHTWYWDGVLRGHQFLRGMPGCDNCLTGDPYHDPAHMGFYMAEQIVPDMPTCTVTVNGISVVKKCPRTTLQLAPGEFVLTNYGDIIKPIIAVNPACSLDSSANGNRFSVKVHANMACNVTFKLWALGELSMKRYPDLDPDPTTPLTPTLTFGPVVGVTANSDYSWGHNGQLPGGYLLKEGLYEVEVIAVDANGVEQRAYQVLPFAW